jgi:hypothetical protein
MGSSKFLNLGGETARGQFGQEILLSFRLFLALPLALGCNPLIWFFAILSLADNHHRCTLRPLMTGLKHEP